MSAIDDNNRALSRLEDGIAANFNGVNTRMAAMIITKMMAPTTKTSEEHW